MRIEEYPRPNNDTGIGFHYFPDADHTGRADVDRWVPRLQALGASWLVMETPATRPVPDSFLQRMMMAGIEPVVVIKPERTRTFAPTDVLGGSATGAAVAPLDLRALLDTVRSMADSGVRYVVLFDRPNRRESWLPSEWRKPALVERFVDYLVPALEVVAAEEMIPVLPPLEPFGAYWDTAFLQTMLSSLMRRGMGPILRRAAVGMRNFANNRPLDWGTGGRRAWPKATPYADDGNGQDHRGFRLFDWYQAIIQEQVGCSLPLIACANGPQGSRMEGQELDPTVHAGQATEMARLIMAGELPPTVMNHAFWLLAAEPHQECYQEAWFGADATARLPAGQALEQLPKQPRPAPAGGDLAAGASTPVPADSLSATVHGAGSAPEAPAGNSQKPIDHYLLLPVFEWGVSRWHLSVVQEYIETFLPTCGFSVEDARLARRVTIVGNEQGVSAEACRALEAAGCRVERIAGDSGLETQRLIQQLARNKQHSRQ